MNTTIEPYKREIVESVQKAKEGYSNDILLLAIISTLFYIPTGFVVPVYIYYKVRKNEAKNQSRVDAYTAIAFPILGMIAVEFFGKKAKYLTYIIFGIVFIGYLANVAIILSKLI